MFLILQYFAIKITCIYTDQNIRKIVNVIIMYVLFLHIFKTAFYYLYTLV
jgi:hypothetical protein